jgi:hypothetical protein
MGLTAIALNGVVGSGIFVLPATVYGLAGAASPAAYLLAAALMALVVACFAEAGSRFDETGGPYLYARAAFGDFAGFLVGWMFLLSRPPRPSPTPWRPTSATSSRGWEAGGGGRPPSRRRSAGSPCSTSTASAWARWW